jgi:hypothetical protein
MFTTHAHVKTVHDGDARRAHLKIVGLMKTACIDSGTLNLRSGKRAPTRCYDAPNFVLNDPMRCFVPTCNFNMLFYVIISIV